MQKAKLEIFVQCLTKTLVQFLLQAACRLSHRWEEKCWDLLHTLAFYHQACPKPTNLGTKVGAAQCLYYMFCSEADHLELVFSLPVSPWPMTGSHSSCPRTYSLHSPGNLLYGAGQSTACVCCPVNLLGSPPAYLARCKRETGGTAVEALGTQQGRGELETGRSPEASHWERSSGKCSAHRMQMRRKLQFISYAVHRTLFFNYIFFSSKKRQIVPAPSCSHYVPIIILILIVYQLNFTLKGW